MPTSACCASAKPSAKAASPWHTLETPTETGSASSAWARRSRSRNESLDVLVSRTSARSESSRWSNSEPGAAARSDRASASLHGSATRTTCGWSRSQPRRAARPSRSPRERPPASSSKKSLMRFFSVSCSITCTFLIPTATWLAIARPSSTRVLPSATSSPMSSPVATSGMARRVLRPPRASSGPSSASPSVGRAFPGSGSLAARSSSSRAGSRR